MFRSADLILFTKVDLLPYFDYDIEAEKKVARKLRPYQFVEFENSFIESLPFKITSKQYMQLIHIIDGHLTWPCIPDFNTSKIYSEILRNGKIILTK